MLLDLYLVFLPTNHTSFVSAHLPQTTDSSYTFAFGRLVQPPREGHCESILRQCGIIVHCQEMTALDNACEATHDRGSTEPECHAGLQEQEAELYTLAIFINDSKAPELVNSQTTSTCDMRVVLLCFQPRLCSEEANRGC